MKLRFLGMALLLAGCQLGDVALPNLLSGEAKPTVEVIEGGKNPIIAGDIAVTSLDYAPPEAPSQSPPAVAAQVVKSASHLACEARAGHWNKVGTYGAICQLATKDAGKTCSAATDCTGYCLAKSASCAPVTPMLGCHEILNDAGRLLTECVN